MQVSFRPCWYWLCCALLLSLAQPLLAQPYATTGPYRVGYQRIQRYDISRSFDTTRTDSLRFRPVQFEVFYPASQPRSAAATLPYGYFLTAYGSRLNFGLSADSCRRLGALLAEQLRTGLDLAAQPVLGTLPTQSILAVPMAVGPFPLLLYCPAYNGLSYENLLLLEDLASQGYVVAAIGSVGKFPGYMTMDPVDIREQVRDAQFARAYLQRTAPVARDQVAVLGYSWGGLAATLLAMQDGPPVQAVVSLDGSERYTYGEDAAEDAQFSRIRQAPYFQPHRLAAPYLYVSSGREDTSFPIDSVYVLPTSTRLTTYVRLLGTQHEDFSYLPTLASRVEGRRPTPLAYPLLQRLVSGWLKAQLRHQASFSDTLRALLQAQPTRLTLAPPSRAALRGTVTLQLRGTTTDAHGQPLPYVSIGVVGANQGTVSRADGTFELRVRDAPINSVVRLSRVGYQSRERSLASLSTLASAPPVHLALQAQAAALPEVVVRARRPVRRVLGNATTSRFLTVGFGSAEPGAQVGIPLHLGKRPVLLEKVTVQLAYNRYDSLLLRLNVYRLDKGLPTTNLLPEQVLVHWGKQTGSVVFDLASHPLAASGNLVVAVELLAGWGGPARALFLAAGLLNGPSYYRHTSEGGWRRAAGMGVGIQATAILAQTP